MIKNRLSSKENDHNGMGNNPVRGILGSPGIGSGNPVETRAIASYLTESGISVATLFPTGPMVRLGQVFHIKMTSSTQESIAYIESSHITRSSRRTQPLIAELKLAITKTLQQHPNAEFFLTPQNMMGEAVVTLKINGKNYKVIMILPDAMGKLHPNRRPSDVQKQISYLVWNETAYELMTRTHQLRDVQLIELSDPLAGMHVIEKTEITDRGYDSLFHENNLCIIKLSGSGGDPQLINSCIKSLWDKSKVQCFVFPGQLVTQAQITNKSGNNRSPKVLKSLDEELYYNIARNIIPNEHMFLTYPSEQFKHMMILSNVSKFPKVVWLPPRGEHELVNLALYLSMANAQGLQSKICVPVQFQPTIKSKLHELGKTQKIHYEFVEPDKLSKQDFLSVPLWTPQYHHTPIAQAVLSVLAR